MAAVGAAAAALAAMVEGAGAVRAALLATVPMLVFLTSALSLAALAVQSGLSSHVVERVARAARCSAFRVYCLVCLVTAALTVALSLDGAVVLLAPVLVELRLRYGAPLAPNLLGTVAVANAVSAAAPQGNPTNIVLLQRLGLSVTAFAEHLLPASIAAALASAGIVALLERRRLRGRIETPVTAPGALGRPARRALGAIAVAGLCGGIAPLVGISPVWPFAAVTALALVGRTSGVTVPWRLAVQIASLLVVLAPLARRVPVAPDLVTALGVVSVVAAVGNNLPAAAAVASLPLSAGGSVGAVLGLSVGALATPHGSVATLLAAEMADPESRVRLAWPLAVAAAAGVLAAGIVAELTFL